MKKSMLTIVSGVMFTLMASPIYAHCEIPCGIYDDQTRIKLIKEHIKTIAKSMKKITELSKGKEKDFNQIVRWINNKEEHAKKIQYIVTQYFMTQRIKYVEDKDSEKGKKYRKELELLHKMLIYAMKAKQCTDSTYIEKLNSTIDEFEKSYMGKK